MCICIYRCICICVCNYTKRKQGCQLEAGAQQIVFFLAEEGQDKRIRERQTCCFKKPAHGRRGCGNQWKGAIPVMWEAEAEKLHKEAVDFSGRLGAALAGTKVQKETLMKCRWCQNCWKKEWPYGLQVMKNKGIVSTWLVCYKMLIFLFDTLHEIHKHTRYFLTWANRCTMQIDIEKAVWDSHSRKNIRRHHELWGSFQPGAKHLKEG